jgi:hypothetical protein
MLGDRRALACAGVIMVAGLALRAGLSPQLEGLDDAGYLDAARAASEEASLERQFPLFRFRIGIGVPAGLGSPIFASRPQPVLAADTRC